MEFTIEFLLIHSPDLIGNRRLSLIMHDFKPREDPYEVYGCGISSDRQMPRAVYSFISRYLGTADVLRFVTECLPPSR